MTRFWHFGPLTFCGFHACVFRSLTSHAAYTLACHTCRSEYDTESKQVACEVPDEIGQVDLCSEDGRDGT